MEQTQKLVVKVPICPLRSSPSRQAEQPELSMLEDEVLLGMELEVTGEREAGWIPVRTAYRYEGWVPEGAVVEKADAWMPQDLPLTEKSDPEILTEELRRQEGSMKERTVFFRHFADILCLPDVTAAPVCQALPMGAVVRCIGSAGENGWQLIMLPDGRTGYIRDGILRSIPKEPEKMPEETLRRALTQTARRYMYTPYRWGGKTPAGIDCSGLCSMVYMLNGIYIYRDAELVEGFPIHEISRDELREGDLMYIPGHICMYLGDGLYIHSTAKVGDFGVTVNSLNPESELYREDIAAGITAFGSWF